MIDQKNILSEFVRSDHLGIYYYNPDDSTETLVYDYSINE